MIMKIIHAARVHVRLLAREHLTSCVPVNFSPRNSLDHSPHLLHDAICSLTACLPFLTHLAGSLNLILIGYVLLDKSPVFYSAIDYAFSHLPSDNPILPLLVEAEVGCWE
ncbi:uncharacterized protein K460DRAFT_9730 [Cucurbitaria berberidis CBS 394.84]|uniref:Uncharacterized protein n=1 Tax=Cucurbitaria berberidis CBS 394.84 TaxID=1168544 RepID=A0A9P4LDF0_9PLEO|nr:uncharacterized protein K460DRAFT_9730 [Cucurbitaria berberidis CBS 394.84]KAF1850039.1 hypothetical protein K460DRAFT_9730 [Cucurbitaria berberidis CBS 394.84]